MIVEALRGEPNRHERRMMGWRWNSRFALSLQRGTRYRVLGLTVDLATGLTWARVFPEHGDIDDGLTSAPMTMFRVMDPRPSPSWQLRLNADGFDLAPATFLEPSFYERLWDHDAEATDALAAELMSRQGD